MTLKYKNMQKTSEQGAGINDVTRISKGATVNGDLISSSDIRVDGVINGKVLSDGKIVVGEQAALSGSLFCANLDFWGKMEGDIEAAKRRENELKQKQARRGNSSPLRLMQLSKETLT